MAGALVLPDVIVGITEASPAITSRASTTAVGSVARPSATAFSHPGIARQPVCGAVKALAMTVPLLAHVRLDWKLVVA
jgi:hypothetical protein